MKMIELKSEFQENDMKGAGGRRIVRDMPYMPTSMRNAIIILWRLEPHWTKLAIILSFILALMLISFVGQTPYLGTGNTLIINNKLFAPAIIVGVLMVMCRWVVPILLNFLVYSWYYSKR